MKNNSNKKHVMHFKNMENIILKVLALKSIAAFLWRKEAELFRIVNSSECASVSKDN